MTDKISYWLDSQNIICKVDKYWDQNMDVNIWWSKRASSKEIVGQNLFSFICDDITRMYVSTMVSSVRLLKKEMSRPYRCDTPDLKRYWQMIVSPVANNGVKVSHELVRTEPLLKKVYFKTIVPPLPLLSAPATDTHHLKGTSHIRCSLCNRISKMHSDQWQDIDTLEDEAIPPDDTLNVLYGICPSCLQGHRPRSMPSDIHQLVKCQSSHNSN